MAAAGVMFEIGGVILAAAMNYEMLIIGRCFLGVAVSPRAHFLAQPACHAQLHADDMCSLYLSWLQEWELCADLLCQRVSANV